MPAESTSSRRLSVAASLIGAIAAAIGVLVFEWPAFIVLALFWCENVIIGIFNAMRILAVGAAAERYVSALSVTAFFIVHYGMFCLVHGVLLATIFGGLGGRGNLLDPLLLMVGRLGAEPVGLLVLASMVMMSIDETLRWWRHVDPHERKALKAAMSAPYARIVVLHLALLLGGFALQALGAPGIAVLILIGLKLGYDIVQLRTTSTKPLAGAVA